MNGAAIALLLALLTMLENQLFDVPLSKFKLTFKAPFFTNIFVNFLKKSFYCGNNFFTRWLFLCSWDDFEMVTLMLN